MAKKSSVSYRRFYRVQHSETERGAYTGGGYLTINETLRQLNEPIDSPRHPSPQEDSLLSYNLKSFGLPDYVFPDNSRFGFVSLKQFRAWFFSDLFLAALHEKGFELAIFKVLKHDLVVGNAQAIMLNAKSYVPVEKRKLIKKG